jgi:hypothetical protein
MVKRPELVMVEEEFTCSGAENVQRCFRVSPQG